VVSPSSTGCSTENFPVCPTASPDGTCEVADASTNPIVPDARRTRILVPSMLTISPSIGWDEAAGERSCSGVVRSVKPVNPSESYAALTTLPDLMQRVQTRIHFFLPLTIA